MNKEEEKQLEQDISDMRAKNEQRRKDRNRRTLMWNGGMIAVLIVLYVGLAALDGDWAFVIGVLPATLWIALFTMLQFENHDLQYVIDQLTGIRRIESEWMFKRTTKVNEAVNKSKKERSEDGGKSNDDKPKRAGRHEAVASK